MKRLLVPAISLALIALLASSAGALAAKPTTSMAKAGGCSTLIFSWSSYPKANVAQLRIHHFGIFETSRSVGVGGQNGSFAMPADVTFLAGDQYTVLGVLLDASGRTITPSGAVWYGTC